MVIERFKSGDPIPVYRRFRDQGRMMDDAVKYVGSWITEDLGICYQVMETDDRKLLDDWMSHWDDIVSFEIFPVLTSAEVRALVAPRLDGSR
jgi:hypothetical protein